MLFIFQIMFFIFHTMFFLFPITFFIFHTMFLMNTHLCLFWTGCQRSWNVSGRSSSEGRVERGQRTPSFRVVVVPLAGEQRSWDTSNQLRGCRVGGELGWRTGGLRGGWGGGGCEAGWRGAGVMGLLKDPYPHIGLGGDTSFTLKEPLMMTAGLWSPLVTTGESLILLCCVLIIILILIYWLCYVCTSWIDSSFEGTSKQRLVNQVLGNLVHLHYLGVVTLPSGHRELVTTWDHYRYALNGDHGTTQRAVSHGFWVSIFSIMVFSSLP
jgi:hypothetical protein